MRAAATLLLALLAAVPAAGAVVRVKLTTDVVPASPLQGTLVGTPVEASDDGREATAPVANGQAVLTLTPGTWRLRYRDEAWWHAPQFVTVQASDLAVILPLRRAGRLAGTVSTADREPAGSLEVDLQEIRSNEHPAGDTIHLVCPPPSEGKWRCVAPAGSFDLRLRVPRYMSQFFADLTVRPGAETVVVSSPFRRGAAVYGRVVTAPGVPAAALRKASVTLSPDALGFTPQDKLLSQKVTADARGGYHFEALRAGQYSVEASAPNLQSRRLEFRVNDGKEVAIVDPLVLEPPKSLTLDVRPALDPDGKTWRITLTEYRGRRGNTVAQAFADRDGSWSWAKINDGDYHLEVGAHAGGRWFEQLLTVDGNSPVLHVAIPLTSVRGTLLLGDKPLRDAKVTFGGDHGAREVVLTSNDDGVVEGTIPDRDRETLLIESDVPPLSRELRDVELRKSESGRRFQVTLPTTSLAVTVVDGKGEPVEGALVNLQADDRIAQRGTAGDGKVDVVGLSPGDVVVQATAFKRESDPAHVQLSENEQAEVKLQLRDDYVLHGVVLSVSGSPVAGAEIWPVAADKPLALHFAATSGADGRFVHFLPPGAEMADLTLFAPGFAVKILRVALDGTPVTLLAGPDGGELDLQLPTADFLGEKETQAYLIHDGGTEAVRSIVSQWRTQSTENAGVTTTAIPMMEAGVYALCSIPPNARLAAGANPAPFRCTRGYLPAGARLALTLK